MSGPRSFTAVAQDARAQEVACATTKLAKADAAVRSLEAELQQCIDISASSASPNASFDQLEKAQKTVPEIEAQLENARREKANADTQYEQARKREDIQSTFGIRGALNGLGYAIQREKNLSQKPNREQNQKPKPEPKPEPKPKPKPKPEPKQEQKQDDRVDEKKLEAFKKIYRALHDSQWGIRMRSNFLKDNEDELTIKKINTDIDKNKKGCTAKAWELAEKYFDDINLNTRNRDTLLKAIHQYSFEQQFFSISHLYGSWCRTIFCKETLQEKHNSFTTVSIEEYAKNNPNTRTGIIYRSLKK